MLFLWKKWGFPWSGSELFPTKWSAAVFVSYMALFVNQGILITATKNQDNTYNYNPTTVILITEILKLFAASGLHIYEFRTKGCKPILLLSILFRHYLVLRHTAKDLILETYNNLKVLLLYCVPALLYCLYNNLAFVNLVAFDPTTYFLLLQLRVVVTGIVFQVLFKKYLSCKQWLSLLLLTVGCIIKEIPTNQLGGIILPHFSINLPLVLVQIFCSCFAGVYNEYLLKSAGSGVPVMLQNVFLYVDSILCNVVLLMIMGKTSSLFAWNTMQHIVEWKVICIILNNAAVGIVTSLFLHTLNSILKTFASALELMFTAVLCWIIFDIPVDLNTAVAILVVSMATFIYAGNPVINNPKESVANEKEEAAVLLNGQEFEETV